MGKLVLILKNLFIAKPLISTVVAIGMVGTVGVGATVTYNEIIAPKNKIEQVENIVQNNDSEVLNESKDLKDKKVEDTSKVETKVETPVETPIVEESTPVVKESTPVVKESTPVVKESTPVVKESTPVVKESTPVTLGYDSAYTEKLKKSLVNNVRSYWNGSKDSLFDSYLNKLFNEKITTNQIKSELSTLEWVEDPAVYDKNIPSTHNNFKIGNVCVGYVDIPANDFSNGLNTIRLYMKPSMYDNLMAKRIDNNTYRVYYLTIGIYSTGKGIVTIS